MTFTRRCSRSIASPIATRAAVLLLLAYQTSATTYYTPSFGPPVVVGDKLIFANDLLLGRRLICIDRKTGTKHWEVTDRQRIVKPWFELDGRLVVTSGSGLKGCDVESGKLTPLYDPNFKECTSVKHHGAQVFVLTYLRNGGYLMALDPKTWARRWDTPRIHHVSAYGPNVLLCVEGLPAGNDASSYVHSGLAAISARTGKVLWRQALAGFEFPAIATTNEFIVAIANKALCLSQADGRVLKEIQLTESPYASVAFVMRGEKPLMWSHFTLSELSVPNLDRRDLFYAGGYHGYTLQIHDDIALLGGNSAWHIATGKKIWQHRGRWHESPVHEGFLYFGKADWEGKTTSMNKIEIASGKIQKLYQEELK